MNSGIGTLGRGCLLCSNSTQSDEDFIVYGLAIVEQSANNFLDTLFARLIELWARIFLRSELFGCTIDDFSMFVWRMPGTGCLRMSMLAEDSFDVSFHGEPTGAFRMVGSVVPF